MKAIACHRYGAPEALRIEDVEKPTPGDSEVLIQVRAASLNAYDWGLMRGRPLLARLVRSTPLAYLWTCGCELDSPLSKEELQPWLSGPLDWLPEDRPGVLVVAKQAQRFSSAEGKKAILRTQ